VLLVPGWSDRASALRHIKQFLVRHGHAAGDVITLDFKDRFGSNIEHAHEIAGAIDRISARPGFQGADIVAHSMGGLAVRYLLQTLPQAGHVRTVIFLGTPHRGTWAGLFAWGGGRAELMYQSEFTRTLKPDCPPSVQLYCIYTPFDMRIFPRSSAILPGARNEVVRCAGHRRLLRSGKVLNRIAQILERQVQQ
jgi:triacylglycerol lipase